MRIALRSLASPFLRSSGCPSVTATGPDARTWRVDVPGVADSIPLLRRWVRVLLVEDGDLADAFELIVSEYGTNALQHTASGAPGGRIRAELRLNSREAQLTVLDDGGAGRNHQSQEKGLAENGRGLLLADAFADEVGHDDTTEGHASWALIHRPDPATTGGEHGARARDEEPRTPRL
jgi:anti-sigma regulatory factor (Ser/Thr protein kinase)